MQQQLYGQPEPLRHPLRPLPYPLSNIQGQIEMIDGTWTLGKPEPGRELVGDQRHRRGDLSRHFGPDRRGKQLTLSFAGDNVPLEEELRDALPPNMGQAVELAQAARSGRPECRPGLRLRPAADEPQGAGASPPGNQLDRADSPFPIDWKIFAARFTTRTAKPGWKTSRPVMARLRSRPRGVATSIPTAAFA